MKNIGQLNEEYSRVFEQQVFVESKLDYRILEHHKILLQQLAHMGNSGVTVFDLFKKEHVFSSYNLETLFGYDMEAIEKVGTDYFTSRIHPEDCLVLTRNGIHLLDFILSLPVDEQKDYKLVNEYRILNQEGNYIRVIEQHQALEQDCLDNLWLSLAVIDISPNQEEYQGVRCQLLNFKTGKFIPLFLSEAIVKPSIELTRREIEVLELIREGLLSKEISNKLFISVHTVNTHRQRILEKLGADNSMEAVKYASQLGLLQ